MRKLRLKKLFWVIKQLAHARDNTPRFLYSQRYLRLNSFRECPKVTARTKIPFPSYPLTQCYNQVYKPGRLFKNTDAWVPYLPLPPKFNLFGPGWNLSINIFVIFLGMATLENYCPNPKSHRLRNVMIHPHLLMSNSLSETIYFLFANSSHLQRKRSIITNDYVS